MDQGNSLAPIAGVAVAAGGVLVVAQYTSGAASNTNVASSYSVNTTPGKTGSTSTMLPADASRFLAQATNGATRQDINYLCTVGYSAWLVQQFSMSRGSTHWDYMVSKPKGTAAASKGVGFRRLWDWSIWRQLIKAPDQLRQRVSLALLDHFVVSINGLTNLWPNWAMASYMDLLMKHTFGNFRALLGGISTSSAMGQFLTFLNSTKANASGSMPDENFARELMQLFTIGLYELNMDGTLRLDAKGQPIDTYSQQDVTQLARVFTGMQLASSDSSVPDPHSKPLVFYGPNNETGSSTFLGKTVGGGGMVALNAALDVIFNHSNLPPFFARALIQRLVTSNPSPGYILRVANLFANNGQGVRGDMRTVINAVLSDNEARGTSAIGAPHTGKLRDPVQRLTHWARAFEATSTSGDWGFGDMTPVFLDSPGRSPSVFNFFRARYTPPNSELQRRGLVAPELQITDEQTTVAYVNYMEYMIRHGLGDIKSNYPSLKAIADNTQALLDEVNIVLAAGQLTGGTKSLIASTINTLGTGTDSKRAVRVWTALTLVMASPDYLVTQ